MSTADDPERARAWASRASVWEGLARPSQVATRIIRNKIKVRNVAGNRES